MKRSQPLARVTVVALALVVAVVCAATPGRAAEPTTGAEGVVRKTVDEAFAVL